LLQAHVGLNGAKLSAGAAVYNPLIGYAAKVSVVRLWRQSGTTPSRTTLVGPELEMGMFMARLTVGMLWPVGSGQEVNRRFTWGVGLGF
jgi:hypothetical protein